MRRAPLPPSMRLGNHARAQRCAREGTADLRGSEPSPWKRGRSGRIEFRSRGASPLHAGLHGSAPSPLPPYAPCPDRVIKALASRPRPPSDGSGTFPTPPLRDRALPLRFPLASAECQRGSIGKCRHPWPIHASTGNPMNSVASRSVSFSKKQRHGNEGIPEQSSHTGDLPEHLNDALAMSQMMAYALRWRSHRYGPKARGTSFPQGFAAEGRPRPQACRPRKGPRQGGPLSAFIDRPLHLRRFPQP